MGDLPSSQRARLGCIFLFSLLAALSLSLSQASYNPNEHTGSLSSEIDLPHIMPPHPRMREAIEQGLVDLPESTAEEKGLPGQGISIRSIPERSDPQRAGETQQLNVLAALVGFSDKAGTASPVYFDNLIFESPKAGRGSVRDYYAEVSYGQVDITTINHPSAWINLSAEYSDYVGEDNCTSFWGYPANCQKLAEDVVDALNPTIDFSQYDNDHDGEVDTLMIIHAGQGAEFTDYSNPGADIWSHSWVLHTPRKYDGVWITKYVIMPEYFFDPTPGDMTIGVFAHELGHGLFGLPDLYDTDYSSAGAGNWSLMASGSWNGPLYYGYSDGSSPAWPDAWSRMQVGWVSPISITTNVDGQVIAPAHLGSPNDPRVYSVYNGNLGAMEYFLVENRQKAAGTYDEYLPGQGLLVWRVDEAMWYSGKDNDFECTHLKRWMCSDNQHYLVALEQADGDLDLEYYMNEGDAGDPFGTSAMQIQTFSGATMPDTSSWYGTGESGITIDQITLNKPGPKDITVDIQVDGVGTDLPPALYLPVIQQDYLSTNTIEEGFEEGMIPPTGWQHEQTDPQWLHTWTIINDIQVIAPHSGIYATRCYPHQTTPYDIQNELLLSPSFYASKAELTFFSYGNRGLCSGVPDLYLNQCDLNIWLVYNGWGGTDDRLVYKADQDWLGYWGWAFSQVNLSPYLLPGVPAQIGFQYYSQGNGAQVGLDDVVLVYLPSMP